MIPRGPKSCVKTCKLYQPCSLRQPRKHKTRSYMAYEHEPLHGIGLAPPTRLTLSSSDRLCQRTQKEKVVYTVFARYVAAKC
jgi:hypothetical protein